MTEKQAPKDQVDRLKKDIETLKNKIVKSGGNKSEDKTVILKSRTWRKSIKRAQRKVRFLTGKKLLSKRSAGADDKKAAPAAAGAQA
jgi:hypothetical protein